MSNIKLLGESKFYEVQKYGGPNNLDEVAVAFTGSLRQHSNPNLVMLIHRPLEQFSVIYEFRVEDIITAEEISNITRQDGVVVEIVKVWVRKNSVCMKMEPVKVETSPGPSY